MCLAGVLESFQDGAEDILRRFAGVRLSPSSVRRTTEEAGASLARRQQRGDIVVARPWRVRDFRIEDHRHTAAYVGLDAFSVPIQGPKGAKADHRMIYAAVLYNPDKSRSHYLADFDLDALAVQMRQAVRALGLGKANQLIAITDAGNGLEEALRGHFWQDMTCILDWYHASQHLHGYAALAHPDAAQAASWADRAKGILYEEGGEKLLEYLRTLAVPEEAPVAEERRKLIGYFENNVHRTDYPSYRSHGWDIGSGPTEAACKIVGARLKGSGMRWYESGAAQVAPLRALYHSGAETWDAFWALAA